MLQEPMKQPIDARGIWEAAAAFTVQPCTNQQRALSRSLRITRNKTKKV